MKWLLLAILVSLASAQDYYEDLWNTRYDLKDYGFLIRGWKVTRCAGNYPMNITNIVISPDNPQFPGPIFFHVTMDVKEDLPRNNIDLDLEVRAPSVRRKSERKQWKTLPCEGWNMENGCGGYGSCGYCDINIVEQCNKTVIGAFKYVKDRKVFRNNTDSEFVRINDPCPPPKGQLTMTFSKDISSEDISQSFVGHHFTSEYRLNLRFRGKDKELGCIGLWIDVCRYRLADKEQKCLKRPRQVYNNCFGGFEEEMHWYDYF